MMRVPLSLIALAGSLLALTSALAGQQSPPPFDKLKTQTSSNLKQVALGVIMYSSDWDDMLPYVQNTATVQRVITPYLRSNAVWKTENPLGGKFMFNTKIGGLSMTAIDNPAEMPMFVEEKIWPDGTRYVAFLDGHVKPVSKSSWGAIDKQWKRKFARKGKPLPAK